MKKVMLFALLASAGLFAASCDNKSGDTGSTGTAAAPAAGGGGDIGVAECDDYIKKMQDCLGKMPDAAKTAMESAFNQSKIAWKQAAATQAGKDALKLSCKTMVDTLAQNPACK